MAEEAKKRPTLMTFNADDIVGRGTFKNWFGRTDQDSYLELSDGTIIRSDKGKKLNTAEEVDQVNERAQEYIAKKNEEIQKQIDAYDAANETKKEDDTRLITKDLDLKSVDDTEESIAATDDANKKFTDAAVANENAFGGDDVTDVVQDNTSFIDPDLLAAQEKIATLQAELDAKSVTAENESGGTSSIINQPGGNQTTSNSGDALGVVSAGAQNLNSGTAKGGVMEAAAAGPTSSGSSEDKAIEMYKKGRRSTILTTAGGLLNDDKDAEQEGTLRRRRGLIA